MHAIFAVHNRIISTNEQKMFCALSYRKSSTSQCTLIRLALYEETQLDLITN